MSKIEKIKVMPDISIKLGEALNKEGFNLSSLKSYSTEYSSVIASTEYKKDNVRVYIFVHDEA